MHLETQTENSEGTLPPRGRSGADEKWRGWSGYQVLRWGEVKWEMEIALFTVFNNDDTTDHLRAGSLECGNIDETAVISAVNVKWENFASRGGGLVGGGTVSKPQQHTGKTWAACSRLLSSTREANEVRYLSARKGKQNWNSSQCEGDGHKPDYNLHTHRGSVPLFLSLHFLQWHWLKLDRSQAQFHRASSSRCVVLTCQPVLLPSADPSAFDPPALCWVVTKRLSVSMRFGFCVSLVCCFPFYFPRVS